MSKPHPIATLGVDAIDWIAKHPERGGTCEPLLIVHEPYDAEHLAEGARCHVSDGTCGRDDEDAWPPGPRIVPEVKPRRRVKTREEGKSSPAHTLPAAAPG